MADEDEPRAPRGRGNWGNINWLAIRTAYAEGQTNLSELAKHHGTTRQSIHRQMRADKEAGREWASRKAIRDTIVTGVTQTAADSISAEATEAYLTHLRRHAEIEALQIDVAVLTLGAAKSATTKMLEPEGATLSLEQVQINKAAVELANKATQTSRLIEGIARDMPSVARHQKSDDDGSLVIQQRRAEPKMVPTDGNGRVTRPEAS